MALTSVPCPACVERRADDPGAVAFGPMARRAGCDACDTVFTIGPDNELTPFRPGRPGDFGFPGTNR